MENFKICHYPLITLRKGCEIILKNLPFLMKWFLKNPNFSPTKLMDDLHIPLRTIFLQITFEILRNGLRMARGTENICEKMEKIKDEEKAVLAILGIPDHCPFEKV